VLPGVNLISLQKPREKIPADFPIVDWMDDCHDFADTAGLIEECDLVVSVDTAVAHLAGALGKETYNFVRYSGYWPWLAPSTLSNEHHSIWYSTMCLLRQPALHNWQKPIDSMVEILEHRVVA
jgi:ADP-heptose:LPS heptosyltransferase